MANRAALLASIVVLFLLAGETVQGRMLLQKSKKSGTGLSTDKANAAAAFIQKAARDVADPNNGNGVVPANKPKGGFAAPTGKPQEISRTTYGDANGASTSAQATTAEHITHAARGGTVATPKTQAGIASKVIPQTTFKAAPAASETGGLSTMSVQTSADINKDAAAIAAKAGRRL